MRLTRESKLAIKNADNFVIQTADDGYFLVARKGDAISYIQDYNAPLLFPLLEDAVCFIHDRRGKSGYTVERC